MRASFLLLSLSCALSGPFASPPSSNDPTAELIRAVEAGDAGKVSELIKGGANVRARCRDGHPLLTAAVRGEHTEIVRILIAGGADLTEDGGAVWLAAFLGNDALVRLLLDAGAKPDAAGGNPWRTPLSWAVERGWSEVMHTLISRGANVNAVGGSPKQTALSLASELGHKEATRILLASRADVDRRDEDGWTALMRASSKCYFEIVEALVDAHADLGASNKRGSTALALAVESDCTLVARALESKGATDHRAQGLALLAAIRTGRLPQARSLIRSGADPNSRSDRGATCLGVAVRHDYEELVGPLLQRGADVNAKDDWGRTPLMWAAALGRPTLVRTLIGAGADLDVRDDGSGMTALMLALSGEASLEPIRNMMVVARNAGLGPPEHHPFESSDWKARLPETDYGRVESARLLIAAGADLTARTTYGATALVIAANNGTWAVVRELIRAQPRFADQNAQEALRLAACRGPLDVVDLLLDAGAARECPGGCFVEAVTRNDPVRLRVLFKIGCDANMLAPSDVVSSTPDNNATLLMLASRDGYFEVVQELIAAGADVNAHWNWGGTALILAAEAGHVDVAWLLLAHGARIDATDRDGLGPVARAAQQGHAEVVRLLLESSPVVQADFRRAFRPGHAEVIRAFVENGADVDARDDAGRTPLFWAILDEESVEILLQAGADPNAEDKEGSTPLMMAIENWGRGGSKTAPLLVEAGADLNVRDDTDQTPLLTAVKKGLFPAAKLLLDSGADPDVPDNEGVTPMQWATDHCDRQLIQYLWKVGRIPRP